MKNRRVAFFLGSMGRGGAERVISILSKEYAGYGWETDIGLLLFNKVDYELDKSTRVLDFTGKGNSRLLRIPIWIKNIRNYVKVERPDAVVAFAARINVLVMLACIGLNVKIIASERNDPLHDGRGVITRMMTKVLYPKAEKIVFQTQRVKNQFNSKIKDNSVVIPNPISVAAEAVDKPEKKIVSVGRLTKQKNHKMLLEAFARTVKKHPEYKLHIYGEGELREALTSQAQELGVSEHVFFPGNVMNVHEKICDAEFFVLSSDYEGLSNALLEAMMMGIPCVATDCAGSDEYIENNVNGKLVPVGDTDAMEEALLFMIENESERKAFGRKAKITAESFCASHVLEKWHEIID